MEISDHRKAPKQTNRNVERKNETREGKKKKEREKNAHRRGGENFILPVGGKWEILELIFNAINYLMKHNNLSC